MSWGDSFHKLRSGAAAAYSAAISLTTMVFTKASSLATCAYDVATDPFVSPQTLDKRHPDRSFDGALVGLGKDGNCKPLTRKGQQITPETLAKAKQSAFRSSCCKANQKPDRTIFFTNGIWNDANGLCDSLKAINEKVGNNPSCPDTCVEVIGIFNATSGTVPDLMRAKKRYKLLKDANKDHQVPTDVERTPPIGTLTDVIADESLSGEQVEIWGHSEGTANVTTALYDARNVVEGADGTMTGVSVNLFANIAHIDPPNDIGEFQRFDNLNDPVQVLGESGRRDGAHSFRSGLPPPLGFPHGFVEHYLPEYVQTTDCSGKLKQ